MTTHLPSAEREELRRIVACTTTPLPTSQIMTIAGVSYSRVKQAERAGLIQLTENGYMSTGRKA